MIRPLTLLTLLAAGGAGLHLYQVKHQVSLLDRELREVRSQTEAARARTGVLRAEWQLLNDPERLRRNAAQHLQLETMSPTQFIRTADLERRLPQAVAFAGARSIFAPPVDVAEVEDGTPETGAGAAPALAALARSAPRPEPARGEPARPEPVRTEPMRTEPARVEPRPAPRPAYVVPRVPAPVPTSLAQNAYRPAPSLVAAAAPRPALPAPAPIEAPLASSLGGGNRTALLAPPVPIGSATASVLPPGYAAR